MTSAKIDRIEIKDLPEPCRLALDSVKEQLDEMGDSTYGFKTITPAGVEVYLIAIAFNPLTRENSEDKSLDELDPEAEQSSSENIKPQLKIQLNAFPLVDELPNKEETAELTKWVEDITPNIFDLVVSSIQDEIIMFKEQLAHMELQEV